LFVRLCVCVCVCVCVASGRVCLSICLSVCAGRERVSRRVCVRESTLQHCTLQHRTLQIPTLQTTYTATTPTTYTATTHTAPSHTARFPCLDYSSDTSSLTDPLKSASYTFRTRVIHIPPKSPVHSAKEIYTFLKRAPTFHKRAICILLKRQLLIQHILHDRCAQMQTPPHTHLDVCM